MAVKPLCCLKLKIADFDPNTSLSHASSVHTKYMTCTIHDNPKRVATTTKHRRPYIWLLSTTRRQRFSSLAAFLVRISKIVAAILPSAAPVLFVCSFRARRGRCRKQKNVGAEAAAAAAGAWGNGAFKSSVTKRTRSKLVTRAEDQGWTGR